MNKCQDQYLKMMMKTIFQMKKKFKTRNPKNNKKLKIKDKGIFFQQTVIII